MKTVSEVLKAKDKQNQEVHTIEWDHTVFEALVSVDPENMEYLRNLSTQYQGLEQYDKALSVIERAVKLEPENSELSRVLTDLKELNTG